MRKDAGLSIYEVVLSIGIVTVVLVALVGLVVIIQRNTTLAKNRSEALRLNQEANEWLRDRRNQDWTGFYNYAGTAVWCLDNLTLNSNSGACGTNEYVPNYAPFRRQVRFTRTDLGGGRFQVRADIDILWVDSQGNHTISAPTYFTNWQ